MVRQQEPVVVGAHSSANRALSREQYRARRARRRGLVIVGVLIALIYAWYFLVGGGYRRPSNYVVPLDSQLIFDSPYSAPDVMAGRYLHSSGGYRLGVPVARVWGGDAGPVRLRMGESLAIDGWGSLKLLDVDCERFYDRVFSLCNTRLLFTPA
jgi:hypothetical protein